MIGIELGLHLGSNVPTLLHQALSAIRRNNGTLIGIPDNFAGAYIESDGTKPVTAVGDVLGLLTDRSYGAGNLGPELVTNGGFDADASWIKGAGWAISGGVAAKTPGTASTIVQGCPLAAGKAYEVYYTVSGRTSGQCTFAFVGGTSVIDGLSSTNGLKRCTLTALPGNNSFGVSADSTFNGAIDNISVREVLGNHATQPTTASKPTVTRVPRKLGSELVVNGTFAGVPDGTVVTSLPNWAPYSTPTSVLVTGQSLTLVCNASNQGAAYTLSGLRSGASYRVSMDVGISTLSLYINANDYNATLSVGVEKSFIFTATSTSHTIYFRANNNSAGSTSVDNISAREVLEWTNAISFDGSNDFLQTSITTGNEGWVCAGVNLSNSNTSYLFYAGANSNAEAGVTLRSISGALQLVCGDGVARDVKSDQAVTVGVANVYDGGWTASQFFTGVAGVESPIGTKTRNCTSTIQMALGSQGGTGFFTSGAFSAFVYCPVLPSAADRALIRKWIGSLQGQTL